MLLGVDVAVSGRLVVLACLYDIDEDLAYFIEIRTWMNRAATSNYTVS